MDDEELSPKVGGPLRGWGAGAIFARFMAAAFFGVLLDVLVAVTLMRFLAEEDALIPVLIAVPLVWGLAGIFWLRQMLSLARRILKGATDEQRY